jgi:5-methyltetrahydrofolate--homocysteine methyltransferase|tara:strand:+ start:9876 stop:10799 length:924 start_codon:yes stop_codon:yes gene_type:complete
MVQKLKPNAQKILNDIKNKKIFLLDGATGTYLQNNGLEPGGCPELMNKENSTVISSMADDYFKNGSDIVLTNSFGGNKYRLSHYKLENEVYELNKLSAILAKEEAEKYTDKFVFGSIGPTGEFLEPLGSVTEREMYDAFAEQMRGLFEGGVDGFLIETQIATEETKLAIKVAKENFNILILASAVYDKGPKGYFTMFGLTPKESLEIFFESGAHVVGSNCGNGSENMVEISKQLRSFTNNPLLVQANAGIPKIKKQDIIYPESPEFMQERYKELIVNEINFIGGCCGTDSEHIRFFHELTRRHNESI